MLSFLGIPASTLKYVELSGMQTWERGLKVIMFIKKSQWDGSEGRSSRKQS